MKSDIVFIKDSSFYYKDNEYDFYEILEKNMSFKKLKIIILEEELYIKEVEIKSHFGDLEKNILKKIEEIFPKNDQILYHYEKCKNKKSIYIYSVKGREKVEKLCCECEVLTVVPIQFIMRKILNKKYAEFKALAEYDSKYYYINCSEDVFIDNYTADNIEEVYDYFNKKNLIGKIIVDEKCSCDEYYLKNLEIIKLNFLRLIYEDL
ncbi:hypothetical protein [uncultured Clostridium sp.]|uniref:hypothetical protein n=1 Tax=uncultured Clostridium sp. TaxID=59620 RepID=UPI0025F64EAF|nr:hypothetical protein [uncultured Clostridium sp.]